jgi:hypothetical protein
MRPNWLKSKTATALIICSQLGANRVAAQLVMTNLLIEGNGVTLSWTGGAGPYALQRSSGLQGAVWMNVATSTQFRVVIPLDSDTAFYRLLDRTTNSVTPFSASITGAAERPTPLTNSAAGFGSFFLDGSNLAYKINYTGLSGSPTAAFICGPANTSQTSNNLYSLGTISAGAAGTLGGQVTLSGFEKAYINLDSLYVNIQTAANPNGELRGQIAPVRYAATLRGNNEIPVVQTAGTGMAQFNLVGNELWYNVDYTNLSAPAAVVEINGPATQAQTAPPLLFLVNPGGTSGTISGNLILTGAQLSTLIDLKTYLNILTTNYNTGEIRGQITPAGVTNSGQDGGG